MLSRDEYIQYLDAIASSKDCPFFRVVESPLNKKTIMEGREVIMLGSNNYLGLTTHPMVVDAAKCAIDEYGTGCTGSRALNGTSFLHELLERKISRFFNKDSALVFSSGFLTNLSVLSTLGSRDVHLVADRDSHASTIDGLNLAYAKTHRFEHNDSDSLRKTLEKIPRNTKIWVVVEGVYSMNGDICPLKDIVNVAKSFDAGVIVDDAHGVGVIGDNGRGTSNYYDVEDQVDLIIGTFSKSFASYGGFVVGNKDLIKLLKYTARPFLFTASLPPVNVAIVLSVLNLIDDNREIINQLWRNTRFFNEQLVSDGVIKKASETPIIPIPVGNDQATLKMWSDLYEKGIYTNAILPPAVADDKSMLRLSVMSTMTIDELRMAAKDISEVFHSCKYGKKENKYLLTEA